MLLCRLGGGNNGFSNSITPTYNGVETLPKLYNSLCAQTNKKV